MPVVLEALPVQLFLELMLHNAGTADIFLACMHGCPLERSERLWYKEGGAGRDLAFPVPFFLGNLIISPCDLVGKPCDILHILLRLRRESQHKVQLHLGPSALESLSCTFQDDLLSQSFVDDIPKPL